MIVLLFEPEGLYKTVRLDGEALLDNVQLRRTLHGKLEPFENSLIDKWSN